MILSTITCSNEVRSFSLETDQFSKHSCQSIKMGYSSHVSVYEVKMLRWDLLHNLISFSFIWKHCNGGTFLKDFCLLTQIVAIASSRLDITSSTALKLLNAKFLCRIFSWILYYNSPQSQNVVSLAYTPKQRELSFCQVLLHRICRYSRGY